jgi:Zn-finger nucleic acid-binding protein
MQQIKRDGIEIDRCPVSGGVWLDRGELEKLLGAVQQAAVADRQEYAEYTQQRPAQHRHEQHPAAHAPQRSGGFLGNMMGDDDDYEDYHQKKHGKKSSMKRIFDLFD